MASLNVSRIFDSEPNLMFYLQLNIIIMIIREIYADFAKGSEPNWSQESFFSIPNNFGQTLHIMSSYFNWVSITDH